jgi:hypothetical protein
LGARQDAVRGHAGDEGLEDFGAEEGAVGNDVVGGWGGEQFEAERGHLNVGVWFVGVEWTELDGARDVSIEDQTQRKSDCRRAVRIGTCIGELFQE